VFYDIFVFWHAGELTELKNSLVQLQSSLEEQQKSEREKDELIRRLAEEVSILKRSQGSNNGAIRCTECGAVNFSSAKKRGSLGEDEVSNCHNVEALVVETTTVTLEDGLKEHRGVYHGSNSKLAVSTKSDKVG